MKKLFFVFGLALTLRVLSLVVSTSVLDLSPEQVAKFQDGPSYVYLATHWPLYPSTGSVLHFPFFPILIACVHFCSLPAPLSGLVVSLLSGSLACVAYAALLRHLHWTNWFELSLVFVVFPFRWFNISQLVMSESLFVLCLLLGLLALEKQRPLLGGAGLGLACLTKLSGILLLPAYLFVLFSREAGWRRLGRFTVPALLLPGLLLAYFWVRFEDPLVYLEQHSRLWGGSYFSLPFVFFVDGVYDPGISILRKAYVAFLLLFYVGGLVRGLFLWPRDPGCWSLWLVWTIPVLGLLICLRGEGTNWGMISFARLALPAAPAVLTIWMSGFSQRLLRRVAFVLTPLAFVYNVVEFWQQIV